MIKSICLVRLSALGDVLMCVPLVRTLQRHLPKSSITWVISEPAYSLVAGMAGIEFIVIDKPNGLKDYWRFKQQMRSRNFDILFAAQASFRANLLYPCIRADRKIGYDRIRAKDGHHWFIDEAITPGRDHTLESFLKFAETIGLSQPDIRWDLPIPAEAQAWAAEQLPQDSIFLVNPAASKPERSWSAERYIDVIRYVQDKYKLSVVLTGGPGTHDRSLGDAIAAAVPVINLIGKTKPKQLLAVIQRAHLVLCPDTGPSHMAAALGTSVIALHAVTNVDISGPYPFRHQAINLYPEAVQTVFGKTVETIPWGTHVHGDQAMGLIDVERVKGQIDQVLMKDDV